MTALTIAKPQVDCVNRVLSTWQQTHPESEGRRQRGREGLLQSQAQRASTRGHPTNCTMFTIVHPDKCTVVMTRMLSTRRGGNPVPNGSGSCTTRTQAGSTTVDSRSPPPQDPCRATTIPLTAENGRGFTSLVEAATSEDGEQP